MSAANSLKKQGIKFAITGALAAVLDVTLTWVLQIGLGWLGDTGARACGYVVGTYFAYLLNRRWTFKARASTRRLLAVMVTYGVTFAVNMTLYDVLFRTFDRALDSNLALVGAFAIAQGAATVTNFFVQRWFIFRSTRKSFVVMDMPPVSAPTQRE